MSIPLSGELLLVAVLALVIYRFKMLTFTGTLIASIIALFIWEVRGFAWLAILLVFFVVGSMATRWNYKIKELAGVGEKRKGVRSIENVIGSAYAPLLFVIFASPVGFLASVAAALADNLASEIGVLSKRVFLITTLRPVPPGTDGGVSLFGEFVALVGASLIALTGTLMGIEDPATLFIIALSGFLGCQFDSLVGATLERRGILNKTEVNIAGTLFGGVLALILIAAGVDVALNSIISGY